MSANNQARVSASRQGQMLEPTHYAKSVIGAKRHIFAAPNIPHLGPETNEPSLESQEISSETEAVGDRMSTGGSA
jgi:hypothetical protein